MTFISTPSEALDSLNWYAQMGVDLCVEETPQILKAEIVHIAATNSASPLEGEAKRLNERSEFSRSGEGASQLSASPSHPLTQPSAARGEGSAPPTSIANAIAEARILADAATNLATLEAAVRNFNGCALKKTATNTVFAEGVPASRLMFVGEAPGAEEDRNGVPFCGPSGKLLDRMLSFIGLDRAENFYITNTLFWRPPGNRQPSAEELEICRPFVEKHIALVDPKILVLVGGTATSSVLRDTRGITRLRGQVFSYTNSYMARDVPVHVIYHPSYLLRQPLAKKQAWADLLKLKESLASSL
jgi:uracil-DNA glycosylase family 4